jgi:hypothetical protein
VLAGGARVANPLRNQKYWASKTITLSHFVDPEAKYRAIVV